MIFGTVKLFCPICGTQLVLNAGKVKGSEVRHSRFGYVCGKTCYDKAELKYARMIVGKDDE